MARGRAERRKSSGDSKKPAAEKSGVAERRAMESGWRSWADALVLAFVLAMFVRTYIFELFKIPTGSMIPTLIGGRVAEYDWSGDGRDDLLVAGGPSNVYVFVREGEGYRAEGPKPERALIRDLERRGLFKGEYDRILVNKFAYWFRRPVRGDIVVFKVPDLIWNPAKAMYIKRVVALGGDRLEFTQEGEPTWNGGVEARHRPYLDGKRYIAAKVGGQQYPRFDYVDYGALDGFTLPIRGVDVPEGQLFVMGDNTHSSLDSRYWGAFDLDRLKGKAFFRYWPLKKMRFIR